MTEKRFIEFMIQNSDDGKWNHGFEDMVREEWYHTKDEITAKKCVDLLNEQDAKITEQAIQIDFLRDENKHMRQVLEENRQLKQFKELLCAVLKQEYEDRTNEMNRWAEKEDWNGYRATKLEYGTVIRIAKRIGVDLDN